MCGIAGYFCSQEKISKEHLLQMSDSLRHRGPDDSGFWISPDNHVGIAHRRLSIIDLSVAGRQPMQNEDGLIQLVFNGEIYNYQEIKRTLERAGHQFMSNTDSETVIHAYEEWGDKCLNRFNGMFAFALYDYREKHRPVLFMARDRVGKKPLYYYKKEHSFYFASELKAIMSAVNNDMDVDYEALNFYLALGYVPGDMCIAKGVNKLPPAHALVLDTKKNTIKKWQYWELPLPDANNEGHNEDDLLDELEYLLEDSVRMRLISDVPLGVFLSGGVDSSLIVAMAARCSNTPVKTFTISFPGAGDYDESGYAKIVADYFQTDHTVLNGVNHMEDTIDQLAPFIDEPIGDSSILPTHLVSKLTRQHVTVALGGDGGDELFGGYGHYSQALLDKKRFQHIPNWFFLGMAKVTGKMPPGMKGRNKIGSLRGGPLEERVWGTPFFDISLRKRLLDQDLLNVLGAKIENPELYMKNILAKGTDDMDSLARLDFITTLPEDMMVKVDRASMVNSLEVRAPWLDYRLVEFAFKKVKSSLKVNGQKTRILQKRLARRLLPKELDIDRKQGFSTPMDMWLQSLEGQQWMQKSLNTNSRLFNNRFIKRLIDGELKGRSNGARLWALWGLNGILGR